MPSHRPYARDPNAPPSVTQVIGMLDKPGLAWGAARETAMFAVHHRDSWDRLDSDAAVDRLRRHHRGVWDHRALIGTVLHRINSEWCQGRSVRLADIVSEIRARSKLWQRVPETELYAQLLPMSDGLGKAWRALDPETLSFEQVVRYRSPNPDVEYVGQTDWRARIGGRSFLLELKTTGSAKVGDGKYWDQWRLQLAAYRFATESVAYNDADQEVGTGELAEVDDAAVIHLYANGAYQIDSVQAGPAEHAIFLALRRVYGWRTGVGQTSGARMMLAGM